MLEYPDWASPGSPQKVKVCTSSVTFRFRNFSNCFDGIGIGFEKLVLNFLWILCDISFSASEPDDFLHWWQWGDGQPCPTLAQLCSSRYQVQWWVVDTWYNDGYLVQVQWWLLVMPDARWNDDWWVLGTIMGADDTRYHVQWCVLGTRFNDVYWVGTRYIWSVLGTGYNDGYWWYPIPGRHIEFNHDTWYQGTLNSIRVINWVHLMVVAYVNERWHSGKRVSHDWCSIIFLFNGNISQQN